MLRQSLRSVEYGRFTLGRDGSAFGSYRFLAPQSGISKVAPLLLSMLLSSTLLLAAAPGQAAAQAAPAGAAPAPAVPAPMQVDITLERRKDGKVEPMAASHVFQAGDVIRLRLKSHFDGFLYVLDQGTTGKFSSIFPGAEAGSSNRVRPDGQYLVPAVEDGWFEVEGPAGFDILYFLLSPTALASPAALNFAAPGPVSSLRPRCNDDIFKARGECTDDSAGPATLPPGTALPAPLAPLAQGASRDLVFVDEAPGTVAVAPKQPTPSGKAMAPVLYTFRLAHQ